METRIVSTELMTPILNIINDLGGNAKRKAIILGLLQTYEDDFLNAPHGNKLNKEVIAFRAGWALTYLKKMGYLTQPKNAFWKLTDRFEEGQNLDWKAMVNAVIKSEKLRKQNRGDVTNLASTIDNPHNQILYGPPGTGKTFRSISSAVGIIDPIFFYENKEKRSQIKARYDELVDEKRIAFVTFHQSFGYEDFVEGLKPFVDEESGQLNYETEDGILKRIATLASSVSDDASMPSESIDLSERSIWKMSLGRSGNSTSVYDICIDESCILLGYGNDIDFNGVGNTKDIIDAYRNAGYEYKSGGYEVRVVQTFINTIKVGDIIIVSDGNEKYRGIAEVSGPYEFRPGDEGERYMQKRPVRWLKNFSPSRPREEIFDKGISQKTLYKLSDSTINHANLAKILANDEGVDETRPYVLIIDEINRGNTASIFGELITLIESSKRKGESEAISLTLPYSKEQFSIPNNLYLIATMNTADRSLSRLDTALRRRFHFVEMMPDYVLLKGLRVEGIDISTMLEIMNQRIELLYDREHTLGHAFFLPLIKEPTLVHLGRVFENQIIPLLKEYFFDDWERIRLVLGDASKPKSLRMVGKVTYKNILPQTIGFQTPSVYKVNRTNLYNEKSYKAIYSFAKEE